MPIKKTSKEEVVATCKEVFHRKGYFNTSMNDLSSACGLLKGSFYHYFSSKEEIMKAVLQHTHFQLKEQILAIAYQSDISPESRLERTVGLILNQVVTFRSCLFGNTALETSLLVEDFRGLLQNVFSDILSALENIYQSKMEPARAKKKAMQTVQQMQGAIMMTKVFGNEYLLEECKQSILQSF